MPELAVFYRRVIIFSPVVVEPAFNPARDTVVDVLTIGEDLHMASSFELFKAHYRRKELHLVASGIGLVS